MPQHDYALDIAINSILKDERRIFSYSVDLGCGQGSLGYILKTFTRWLVGVDIDPALLNVDYKKVCYDEVVVTDALTYEIPIETDSIFLFEVIEHFPKEEGIKLLEKLLTLTPPNFIMVSSPTKFSAPGYHKSLWTPDDFFTLGFDDVYLTPATNPRWGKMMVAVRRTDFYSVQLI